MGGEKIFSLQGVKLPECYWEKEENSGISGKGSRLRSVRAEPIPKLKELTKKREPTPGTPYKEGGVPPLVRKGALAETESLRLSQERGLIP